MKMRAFFLWERKPGQVEAGQVEARLAISLGLQRKNLAPTLLWTSLRMMAVHSGLVMLLLVTSRQVMVA